MSSYLGAEVPTARQAAELDIIHAVEQTTNGTTVITIGQVTISGRGRVRERATVRLNPGEREELIRLLMTHRFADLTAGLGEQR